LLLDAAFSRDAGCPAALILSGMRKLFMFSGQGSQYFGMGAELYEQVPVFRSAIEELDAVAARRLGTSVAGLLYGGTRRRSDPFLGTRFTGAAIFMVEYALGRTLQERGVRPDAVLGSSLGTMAAACVAGCLHAATALESIIEKAIILETHCPPGGMVAVLADPQLYLNEPELHERADLAGISSPTHFVIAAPSEDLPAITRWLAERNVASQSLPVSQAFHSRWIDGARQLCLQHFEGLPLRRPALPLFCCAAQGALDGLTAQRLWQVIRAPIHFERTLALLEMHGPWEYVDLGPGTNLATVLKYRLESRAGSRVHGVLNPFGGELRQLERVVQALAH
jgi:acyl transferase domain-containing protein